MGNADFESAYDAGHALTLDEAVAEAKAWLEPFQDSSSMVREQ
ncbi:MAG TPA: hypothetical protein VMN56_00625 [Casimicrobiaceae bacterium]|nr:hypothetical protein [Casimicrobiaceae bacterium]